MENIQETLCQAIDTIVKRRLQQQPQHIIEQVTILKKKRLMTTYDAFEYEVINNALYKYTIKSSLDIDDTTDKIWVLIPEGKYQNTKFILGKEIK